MAITLIVEDGTGLEDSNSYATEAEYITYFTDRGDIPTEDTATIEASLVEATAYIDLRWGKQLRGYPLEPLQALEFPRSQLYDRYGRAIEGLPNDIKTATILYAKEYIGGNLYPESGDSSSISGDVKRTKTVVGPITTELEYHGAADVVAASATTFPLPDSLVKKYTGGASNGGVIRN